MESLHMFSFSKFDKENTRQATPFRKPRTLSEGSLKNRDFPVPKIPLELKANFGQPQQPRKALGNLSNISSEEDVFKKTKDEETFKATKPRRPPLKSYPDIEKMPKVLDEPDDYEDIFPKNQRLSVTELRCLAEWKPLYDVASWPMKDDFRKVELDDINSFKLPDISEDSLEDFDSSALFDDDSLEVIPLP